MVTTKTKIFRFLTSLVLAIPALGGFGQDWPVGPGASEAGPIQTALGLDPSRPLSIIDDPELPVTYKVIEFVSEDGVLLSGRYAHTPVRQNAPVVILIHQGDGAHREFDGFDRFLHRNGYSTFAIDLRGFGGSKNRTDGSTIDAQVFRRDSATTVYTEMDRDVTAALDALQNEGLLDGGKAILLGTYSGGAVVGKATGPNGSRVSCSVLVSTPQYFRGIQLRQELDKIQGVPILIITSEQDSQNGATIRQIADVNPNVIGRRVRGGGVGMLLLDSDFFRSELIEFLDRSTRHGP